MGPMLQRKLKAGLGLLGAAAGLAAPQTFAAEFYIQPIATLSAETDSNLDLDPGFRQQVQGYLADIATIIGIATKDSNTLIKPRITYRYYPQDSLDDRAEGYLDFNTEYRTQRSTASLAGSYEHQDEFNAELTQANFNDVNLAQPPPDTGKVTLGATRDSAIFLPKYTYSLAPTIGVGVSGQFQTVSYSSSDINHSGFDYYLGRAFVAWTFSQRSDVTFGAFGSKYDATHVDSQATGSGATADLNTNWTPLLSTKFSLVFQHTNVNGTYPTVLDTTVNEVGGTAAVAYKTETDQFRLNVGRTISPSGGGAIYTVDRAQFEYDRNLTARLSMTGAIVGLKTHGLTSNIVGDDRKYAQGALTARWLMTRTWFVEGGYQYAWQKYQFEPESGANNRFYIQVGYQGLGLQR
jgi:hypothetical protein